MFIKFISQTRTFGLVQKAPIRQKVIQRVHKPVFHVMRQDAAIKDASLGWRCRFRW